MANLLVREFLDDLLSIRIPISKRLWAYKHGFLARRINEYGLNDVNWDAYEPDFDYYKLHPLNEYSKWIDDKLTTKYVLHPFSDLLPKYYYELRRGAALALMDCPPTFGGDVASVIRLLHQERRLAAKPLSASKGEGFLRLEVDEGRIFVNETATDPDDLQALLASLNRYLVTEYIVAHQFIRQIWSGAPNALRVFTVHNDNEAPVIMGAYARFGTSVTGAVDNIHAGGIACAVDVRDGRLYGPRRHHGDRWVDVLAHPDTNTRIEGRIPHWERVVDNLKEICIYLPHLKYMGFDIVITDSGFKIIEINSHGTISTIQSYFPLLESEQVRRLFRRSERRLSRL